MFWIAIFGPPIGAALFAILQNWVYDLLAAVGFIKSEDRPFYGILAFRGLLLTLFFILSMTIIIKKDVPFEKDPMLGPEQQAQVKRMIAGESPIPDGVLPATTADSFDLPTQADETYQNDSDEVSPKPDLPLTE